MKCTLVFRACSALPFILGVFGASNTSTYSDTSALLSDGTIDLDIANDAYQKAKAFVSTLSNSQKITIITGSSVSGNVSWTALANKDGAAGINNQFYVSGFSEPSALTMTWNRELFAAQWKALGTEFYQDGYNLINGPVSSPLGRVPAGGRVPEGFSPEPYLNGIAMGQAVSGMNAAGVVAAGRHFLLNEQETNRMGGGYSSNADDKTINEVYLWPFADGVKAGLMAVMCGMNKVNDTLSCENNKLLSGYLKTSIGFPGMVFPDVQSQSTSFGSANAGLDYGSSSLWSEDIMLSGIANGSFTQERLDDMAIRNVIGYYFVGLDNGTQPSTASTTDYRDVRGTHADLIRQVGQESLVLLKNSGSLPLKKPRTLALFGAHTGPCMAGPNKALSVQGEPADTYMGHLATSGGSGQSSMGYLITPYQAISARAIADKTMIWWILNDTYSSSSSSASPGGGGGAGGGMGPGANSSNSTGGSTGVNLGNLGSGTSVSPSITNYATNAEVCLVFLNADSGEGADRSSLSDDNQDLLVQTVAANCNNTVVVVNAAGPRVISAWSDLDNVTAILYGGLLGQESGTAIADVLYGDVNPSGKLSYTLAKNASDYPAAVSQDTEINFSEGVLVDYRYFDSKNISVDYPFGYGLSYTSFTYGDLTASVLNASALASKYPTGVLGLGGQSDLWDDVISVTSSIQNSGTVEGSEVAQLYVSFPTEAGKPPRVLRGFEKVNATVGENSAVSFKLRRRDLSYWDTQAQKWAVAKGEYTFSLGASSRDIRASTVLTL